MTEAEWLARTDPTLMLEFLRTQRTTSERKLHLFAASCCRRVWDWLGERSRRALDVMERYLDGRATADELHVAAKGACEDWIEEFGTHHPSNAVYSAVTLGDATAHAVASGVAAEVAEAVRIEAGDRAMTAERAAQCHLLRDIFHGPRRAVLVRSHWRTAVVLDLATSIYVGRAFDRLSILADTLEDAGCDNPDVLAHCRSEGMHVRGCWVVDMILGRW